MQGMELQGSQSLLPKKEKILPDNHIDESSFSPWSKILNEYLFKTNDKMIMLRPTMSLLRESYWRSVLDLPGTYLHRRKLFQVLEVSQICVQGTAPPISCIASCVSAVIKEKN